MKHLTLASGDKLPALGLGTWKSTPGEVGPALLEALRLGYRHIDCASIYGNEAEIGIALRKAIDSGLVKREDLWITSKLWNNAHHLEQVRPALEETLAHLQLEQLDLYLVHWPVALRPGTPFPESADDFLSLDDVPISETWSGMEACFEAGLCRNIGVSNFSVRRLKDLLKTARIRPVTNQVELHPQLPQAALLTYCKAEGIVLTAYSPLGSPDRPPHLKGADEPPLLDHPVVLEVAGKHAVSAAQVLIAWAIWRGTSVIPKSVNPVRMAENLAAADLALDAEDVDRLATVEGPFRYISGSFWAMEGSPYSLADLWGE